MPHRQHLCASPADPGGPRPGPSRSWIAPCEPGPRAAEGGAGPTGGDRSGFHGARSRAQRHPVAGGVTEREEGVPVGASTL